MSEIRSLVVSFRESLRSAILGLIAVGRLCSAEPLETPTAWKDVEALGAPTRYSVDVGRYRFGTTDVRNPASYPIPRHPVTREIVTFEESSPARVAPVWNTHNIGPPLGSHWANTVMHQPVGENGTRSRKTPPPAALHDGQDVPGVPTIGEPHGKDFQSLENTVAMASNDWN